MRVVLLFSGQGAQAVGMGRDLVAESPAAAELLDRAGGLLDFDLGRVMFEGPADELTRTSRCQPALYVHGLMLLAVVRERRPGLDPAAAAGLSLGEFTAHAAAGTFGFEDGLRLVARRGAFMEEACDRAAGGMAAMIGGEEEAIRALAAECGLEVANLNAPGQVVLSGPAAGIAEAVAAAESRELCAAKMLEVAGAYHSRLMEPARKELAAELASVAFQEPRFPVISNFLAAPVSAPDEIRSSLERQVTGSVRWAESMQSLLDDGHETFLELGPGRVLAGLMRRIRRGTRVVSIGGAEDLGKLEELA